MNAIVNNYIHTSFWVYADIFAEQIPWSVIAGWKGKDICNFASHWQYMKMPVLCSLINRLCCKILDFCQADKWEMQSQK